MEGWVGLGTTTASKQSAHDRYVTYITIVSCPNRQASLGGPDFPTARGGEVGGIFPIVNYIGLFFRTHLPNGATDAR